MIMSSHSLMTRAAHRPVVLFPFVDFFKYRYTTPFSNQRLTRRSSHLTKNFPSLTSNNIWIPRIHLCPDFFKKHYPDFIIFAFRKPRLSCIFHARNVIIDDYFSPETLLADIKGIATSGVYILVNKNSGDSRGSFCKSCYRSHKIAIPNASLKNIAWLYFSFKELEFLMLEYITATKKNCDWVRPRLRFK